MKRHSVLGKQVQPSGQEIKIFGSCEGLDSLLSLPATHKRRIPGIRHGTSQS